MDGMADRPMKETCPSCGKKQIVMRPMSNVIADATSLREFRCKLRGCLVRTPYTESSLAALERALEGGDEMTIALAVKALASEEDPA